VWSFIFAIGVVVIHIFYFELQTYVLKVDRILNGMGIVFICLEGFLMLLTAMTFYRQTLLG